MNLNSIQVVVLDLDDTLYPEEAFVHSGFRAVSAYLKEKKIIEKDLFDLMRECFDAGERGEVFNSVLRSEGVEPERALIDSLVDVYRSHKPDISLYPDAISFLERMGKDKKLGLLTDGYLNVQRNKVETLGLEKYFDMVVYTDEIGQKFWKPHKAGYEKIMNAFGVEGALCLYIADNPDKDFFGAKNLGWKTIRLKRPGGIYSHKEPLIERFSADETVTELGEIDS